MDGNTPAPQSAETAYRERRQRFGREEENLARWDNWLSRARLTVFLLVVACLAVGWSSD